MPLSLYESLVKEYLEDSGYLVQTNVHYTSSNRELDILAVKPSEGFALVAEVHNYEIHQKEIDDDDLKFSSNELKDFFLEKYGVVIKEKRIFCWNFYTKDKKDVLKKAGTVKGITVISFPEILKYLVKRVHDRNEEDKWIYEVDHPNILLLQMICDVASSKSPDLEMSDFIRPSLVSKVSR